MSALSGKVAVVTGATSGMGRAIAELFAGEGAAVVFGGRDEQRGAEVVRGIRGRGGRCEFNPGDVSLADTNEKLVRIADHAFGGVDVLVPNVGMLGLGSVTGVALETWHETIATNLHSVFYLLRFGIPMLIERGGGTIVVTGSIASSKGFPNHAAYCASKGAVAALVKQVAIDYAPKIRANLLCPGPVNTPLLWDSARAFPVPEAAVSDVAERAPLKRLGRPLDIARAALFLASDQSSWMTGSALTVDGGITCL
jgi:NAD(P)-dependent dehydrogenase (short-subunit alcohol dehydrogenase family)